MDGFQTVLTKTRTQVKVVKVVFHVAFMLPLCYIYVTKICNFLEYINRTLFSDGKPINSTVSLINQDFCLAGEIIAMSILQGGHLLVFFLIRMCTDTS